MEKGLYAGSFDPITFGHVDIIKKASRMFDKVYVAISQNTSKQPTFSSEQRLVFAKSALEDLNNVEVVVSKELTVDLAKNLGIKILIRGVRGSSDIDSEISIADLNQSLDSTIQTIFIPTSPEFHSLSSSMIKEIARFGGDISKFVPKKAAEALETKFS